MAFLDKTGLECLWGHIAAKLAGKSNVDHTHTAAEVGADASGSAATALTSAKSYTDETVAGATEGMVKSVNGVEPDENGEVTSHHIINIVLYDNTCYPGGKVLCYTHTAKELVKMFRNTTVRMPIVTRRVAAMSGTYKPDVFLQNFNIVIVDGGYEVHFHYGDEYADIIANDVTNTITLDPNWVAPEATATEAYVDEKISAIPQSDWAENDTTSKAYVQNRTHYAEWVESLPETVVEQPADSTDEWPLTTPFTTIPEVGKTYRVTWKGTDYDCVAQGFDMQGAILPTLGNIDILQGTGDNGMPFAIAVIPVEMIEALGAHAVIYPVDGSTGSVTLTIQEEVVHKIPEKFIAQPDWNASEGEEGYIANKTHGVFGEGKEVYSERTLTLTDGSIMINDPYTNCPAAGETCIITWNGIEYSCSALEFTDSGMTAMVLGDAGAAGLPGADATGEPFVMVIPTPDGVEDAGYYAMVMSLEGLSSVTMAIRTAQTIQKLDWKFMHHSDWNAEEGEVGYIENRTHWVNKNEIIILPETTSSTSALTTPITNCPIDGGAYIVTWNGVEYEQVAKKMTIGEVNLYCFGNLLGFGGSKTDDPFGIGLVAPEDASKVNGQTGLVNIYDSSTTYTVSIKMLAGAAIKLDEKFLPNNIAKTSDLDSYAKTSDLNSYATKTYVGEQIAAINIPVDSVNGKTGTVVLSASDVGALPDTTVIPSIEGLATETYVNTAVSNLVDSSPDTLNTLNELAAALGDDPNFATTVTTEIGKKVDKTTTINGQTLSANITLSAFDVGADVAGTATELVSKVESAIINNEYIVFEANSEDGINYTGTIEGLTTLKRGALLVMIPKQTSTSQTNITLNINGLGNKIVYRESLTSLAYGATNDWLHANNPYVILYKGTYWVVINQQRPKATDLDGAVPIAKGGTGATTAAEARTNLGITPENIGALPDTTIIPSIEGLATETYVDTALSNLVDSSPDTLNTLNELASALGDDPNFATTVATEIGKKVDKTTTVNGKALSGNISLSATDIGALPDTTFIPSIEGLATEAYVDDITNNIQTQLDAKVPTSRTINGKTLSGDIILSAKDINVVTNIKNGSGDNAVMTVGAARASGSYSFAEGYNTASIQIYSHAEGYNKTCLIKLSGDANATVYTYTIDDPSNLKVGRAIELNEQTPYVKITEVSDTSITVNRTLSSVALSEAECLLYIGSANAHSSHAEGNSTTASGNSSHAEGYDTIASGNYSHAEGMNTTASKQSSHAEGQNTIANGLISHAEGYDTTASGDYSHAEGNDTTANGLVSHAEGNSTTASGNSSHAEGNSTTASGNSSHAEGYDTIASGNYSHAEGMNTTASEQSSHAEGQNTIANGLISHAEGHNTIANGLTSHAEGFYTVSSGTASHAEGGVPNKCTAVISGEGNSLSYTVSSNNIVFRIGQKYRYNDVIASVTAISGITITFDKTFSSEKLTSATIELLSGAHGNYSHSEGYATQSIGSGSHAEGAATVAEGQYSHAEGEGTVAAGHHQHVEGLYNVYDSYHSYLHILGNGSSSSPHNAHTIDWHGNAWYEGEVYVGGNNWSEGEKLVKQSELETAITSGTVIPSYWHTALDEGAEAINAAMLEAGRNKSAFLFYSDAHWSYNNKKSPLLLKYLYEHTGMNKTFFGGDVVQNEASDYDTMSYIWSWRNAIKGLPNHHSVVGNHDDGNTTDKLFDENYVYGYLLAAEETPDIVRGDTGIYYYIDNPAEKTRYLFLDTAYKSILYDATQFEFVVNALKNTPENWHIVAIAHIWYNTDYTVEPPVVGDLSYAGTLLLNLFDEYNNRSSGSVTINASATNGTSGGTVAYDFSSCGGKVEFCIGGHTHWDYDGKSTGGIPVILVETDSKNVRSGLECTAGTTTENSVNGIICDYDAQKITIVRVGRGEGREVPLIAVDVITYTNVLDIATDTDGSLYNGGLGYKENTRYSTSSKVDTTATGWDITGYFPATVSNTIRMKDVMFFDLDGTRGSTSRAIVYFYDSSYAFLGNSTGFSTSSQPSSDWSPVYNDDGDLIQFTIPTAYSSSTAYIRIGAANIDENSIITVDEEIPDNSGDETIAYTNQLDVATDTDGSLYNGGTGYKANTRISTSSGVVEKTESPWCVTGYFPVKCGDVVRLKNITFYEPDNTSSYPRTGVYGFDSSYNLVVETSSMSLSNPLSDTWNIVTDANGQVTQFTIPSSWDSESEVVLLRLCVYNINDDSIITVNQEITD